MKKLEQSLIHNVYNMTKGGFDIVDKILKNLNIRSGINKYKAVFYRSIWENQ